jgi:CBS domain-containing protein
MTSPAEPATSEERTVPDTQPIGSMPVSAFTADAITSLPADATLFDVVDALMASDVGALVLKDADQVVGVVSERDIVRALAERRPPDATPASDIASTHLVWCDAESTVTEVATEMLEHYVRHVLVEEDGHPVGVVSARDLLGAYAAADSDAGLDE